MSLHGLARPSLICDILAPDGDRIRSRSRVVRCGRRPQVRRPRVATRWVNIESICPDFESLADPRPTRDRKHLSVDVVGIAVWGMARGCDGPTAIHRRASNRPEGLKPFWTLPNGSPS